MEQGTNLGEPLTPTLSLDEEVAGITYEGAVLTRSGGWIELTAEPVGVGDWYGSPSAFRLETTGWRYPEVATITIRAEEIVAVKRYR